MSVNLINKTTGELSKIAGKIANGELIPSVSLYQSGSFYFASGIDGGGNGNQQVTLSTDMPDNDYVVVLSPNNDDIIFTVQKKTKTGFQINAYNKNSYMQQPTGTYQVFKLMTDENRALDEQAIAKNTNDISDLQTDVTGLQEVVPSGASADNQLVAASDLIPIKHYAESENADCNDLYEIGKTKVYHIYKGTNTPDTTKAWYILSLCNNNGFSPNDYVTQIATYAHNIANNADTYIRHKNTTGWTDWIKFIKQSDLTSSVTSGSSAPVTSGGVYSALNTVSTTTVTLSPTNNASDNITLHLRKVGKVVTASFFDGRTDSGTLKSNWANIGTIPAGYRPAEAIYTTINHANSQNVTVGLQFNTNGAITQYSYTDGNLGYERSINLTWITE